MSINPADTATPRMRNRDVYDSAIRMRRAADKRDKFLGLRIDGQAWDLMVEAFLAGLEPRNPMLPLVPMNGAVLESLDPLVMAGLVVVTPDSQAGGVLLELSAEGHKRVQRLFATMAREEAQRAAPSH